MTDRDILIQQLFEQIRLLQAENAVLREEIARLKKNSSNSSKPPSSDIINPRIDLKSKRKRMPGGQNGHGKFIREPFAPEQIDETIIHKLSTQEIQCRNLIVLDETQMTLQQIDLPDKFYKVIEHRVQLYQTPDGKIIAAKLPKGVRAAGLFTTRMTAFTGYMKSRCHMSYSTIGAFFSDIMNIGISMGFLNKCCTRKLSEVLMLAYSDALEYIRQSEIVGTDETAIMIRAVLYGHGVREQKM